MAFWAGAEEDDDGVGGGGWSALAARPSAQMVRMVFAVLAGKPSGTSDRMGISKYFAQRRRSPLIHLFLSGWHQIVSQTPPTLQPSVVSLEAGIVWRWCVVHELLIARGGLFPALLKIPERKTGM